MYFLYSDSLCNRDIIHLGNNVNDLLVKQFREEISGDSAASTKRCENINQEIMYIKLQYDLIIIIHTRFIISHKRMNIKLCIDIFF